MSKDTTETTKGQATQWKIVRHPESPTCFYLHDARGEEMAVTYGDEDGKIAKRILHAVNSHDALLLQLERLAMRFERVCPDADGNTSAFDQSYLTEALDAIAQARSKA